MFVRIKLTIIINNKILVIKKLFENVLIIVKFKIIIIIMKEILE